MPEAPQASQQEVQAAPKPAEKQSAGPDAAGSQVSSLIKTERAASKNPESTIQKLAHTDVDKAAQTRNTADIDQAQAHFADQLKDLNPEDFNDQDAQPKPTDAATSDKQQRNADLYDQFNTGKINNEQLKEALDAPTAPIPQEQKTAQIPDADTKKSEENSQHAESQPKPQEQTQQKAETTPVPSSEQPTAPVPPAEQKTTPVPDSEQKTAPAPLEQKMTAPIPENQKTAAIPDKETTPMPGTTAEQMKQEFVDNAPAKEPSAEGEKTPEQKAEAERARMLAVGAELGKLGLDPNNPEHKAVFDIIAANPDQAITATLTTELVKNLNALGNAATTGKAAESLAAGQDEKIEEAKAKGDEKEVKRLTFLKGLLKALGVALMTVGVVAVGAPVAVVATAGNAVQGN